MDLIQFTSLIPDVGTQKQWEEMTGTVVICLQTLWLDDFFPLQTEP